MRLKGKPDTIKSRLLAGHPAAQFAMTEARFIPAQILPYQAAALFILAGQYNQAGAIILEIGTAAGYSAAIMAQAAPKARVITLNNAGHEIDTAVRNLGRWRNIEIANIDSGDYLHDWPVPRDGLIPKGSRGTIDRVIDMVFVDGDHKQVWRDLGWWRHVREGGLLLCHDYSPADAAHPCPPVYDAVNEFARMVMGHEPDVLIVDDAKTGMAGFYNYVPHEMKGIPALAFERIAA